MNLQIVLEKGDIAEKHMKNIEEWAHRIVDQATEYGVETAQTKFQNALYAGTNDVTVHAEESSEGDEYGKAIVAEGKSLLFIEYGTGVKYGDDHPYASEYGYIHGTYGKGQGANPKGWYYQGDPGNMGEPATNPSAAKRGLMHTFGNPANMSMYETKRDIEERLPEIVKEVSK